MSLLKPRPKGFHPKPKQHRLPPASPSSAQVLRAAVKRRLADGPFGRVARLAAERNISIVGSNGPYCVLDPTAVLANATINASSGTVTIGANAMLSPGVSLLAGTHNIRVTGAGRRTAIPGSGYDIVVGPGAWIASNATVIGPCVIGDNAVVCAGAVVTEDVPDNTVVGGVPARVIKFIEVDPQKGGQ